ncbi:uncharacterized protein G2W53_009781 [Senna tora]|uniref:Uncharacterized protein n=1 Tax=Senna tora TaxID=362788 RepID=A0A834WYL0_9FABA|nr:uncharacterized protein G2W53_009781 [Senna tora]
MGGAWIMSQHIPDDKSRSRLRNLHELRGKRLVAQVSQARRFGLYSRTGVVLMLRLESCWHGRSVDHVLTYSGGKIAVRSWKPSRITRQKTCCTSESNTSVRVVFANGSGFDAPIGVVLAWEERGSCLNIFRMTNRGWISETFTNYEAIDLLRKSVDHVSTYSGRQIAVESQKPSQITRQKTCCASESNTSVRVVFANRSGFDAPIGVVLAWEERGSCLNIFRTTNRGRISETFTNYEAKDMLRNRLGVGGAWIMSQLIPDDKSRSDLRNLHELRGKRLVAQERGSCLNIFRTKDRGRISETFTNYEAKDLLRKSVDRVLTYSERQIAFGSQKPSRITRQKTCCASESNTSVRLVFANGSVFDAPIGVVLAWEERGSCLNIFRTTNRGRISETFTNYEAKDLLRNRLGMGGAWIMSQHIPGRQITVESRKPSRITRQKTCCASESNASVRVVVAIESRFDAPIGVVLAWDERGSCLNIFRTKNRGRISETFTNYEAKDLLRNRLGVGGAWIMSPHISDDKSRSDLRNLHELRGKRLVAQVSQTRPFALYLGTGVVLMLRLELSWRGRSVDHVLTYSGRQIAVGSQKHSRITRQKTCCASESNTSVQVEFANGSGFDAPIGVVLAWEERGSCLNIFRRTNRGRISETFTNYEAKDLLRKSVDHVLTYSGRKISVRSWKPSRITRQKTCCARESNTSVRVVFANGSGFDAPIGVVLAWEERGSCLTYSGRQIAVGSQKPSRITRQKTCCASESNTSVRVVFANESGFDAPIGVVSAWEERGSCLKIFQTTNRGRISETFTNYEAKDLLRKSVDHVSTYFGRQIAVGYQKPSRISRQKTCCANESNTSVRVVFANGSGFDGPIGVVLAWEERGSCLNIFRMTTRGRILETFTNYEAKDLLRKQRLVAQVSQTRQFALFSRTGVVLMLRLELSWHGRSVDHVLTYSGRQIAVESQKPSRFTRQKTCCANESNTSVRVVFANGSGFDSPIGVVLAWDERGSCLNIFWTTNRGRISETFTNYEAKDLLRKSVDHALTYSGRQIAVGSQKPSRITRQKTCCASESNTSEERGPCLKIFGRQIAVGFSETFTNYRQKTYCASQSRHFGFREPDLFDAPIGVVLAWEERGSFLNIFRTTNRGRILETFTNYEAKDLLRKSNTSVRVVFANQSGFDAPVGVVLAWDERGSCLNKFRMKNRGRISETFTNYEAKDLLRKNLHELRGKRIVAQVSQTRRYANRSGFDAPIGVVLAWEERGSCLNIFRTANRGRISETFTNYEAKELLRKNLHELRGKRLVAQVSQTRRFRLFANRSGFDAPIESSSHGRAWISLNIFRTTNRGRISETFTIMRQKTCCASESNTSVCVVFANRSGFDAPIGVFLACEERGSS